LVEKGAGGMRDQFVLSHKLFGYWRVGIYGSSWADTYRLAVAWDKDIDIALAKAKAKVDKRVAKLNERYSRDQRLTEKITAKSGGE
jgi:hypothetical protein